MFVCPVSELVLSCRKLKCGMRISQWKPTVTLATELYRLFGTSPGTSLRYNIFSITMGHGKKTGVEKQ